MLMENLNTYHIAIKFTATWSTEEVTFLDTWVYIKNGLLKTDLHVKPTDMQQYLQVNSCHPQAL